MRLKIGMLLVAICCLSLSVEATVVKGSVGNHASKAYTFTPGSTGTVILSLIYDSPSSDLDLQLAARQDDGSLLLVVTSESTLRQQEEMQVGVLGGVQYTIFVKSSVGPSPFRLSFDGTFAAASTGRAGVATQKLELKEVPQDAAMAKFMQQINEREKVTKHRQ